MANAGEHVVKLAPVRRVVEHLRRRDEGHAVPARQPAQTPVGGWIVRAAVTRVREVERVAEGVAQRGERALLGGGRGGPGPQRDEPARSLADLLDRHDALSLGRASLPGADEPAEPRVPLAVPGEEDERGARRGGSLATDGVGDEVHRQLRADDEPRARIGLQLAGRLLRLDDAVDAVAVGERDRRQSEARRLRDELVRVAPALEEAVVALHPQRNVVAAGTASSAHSTTPWTSHRVSCASK